MLIFLMINFINLIRRTTDGIISIHQLYQMVPPLFFVIN